MRIVQAGVLTVLAVVASASIAAAADLPVNSASRPAPITPAQYVWRGFYAGGVLNYGEADSTHCDNGICSAPGASFPKPHMSGWLGGATLGYNFQMADWVVGVEGDWSWGKIDGSANGTATFFCNVTGSNGCVTDVDWIGTFRGRAGYAFGRMLPYVTAGVAFTRLHASIGTPVLSEGSTTKTGFVWGGGIELALAQNWSAKLEYLHVTNLGDFDYDTAHACGPAPGCSVSARGVNLVRLGLNYKFGGGF